MALLTVYITNYNYGNYIRKAIESVFQQSFQDLELLIIDDGSTDDSRNIIEQYADRANVLVIYQQNKGLNITNNIALQLARSRYIMRLDADDYLKADALEKMVEVLEGNPEIGLVFPDYYLVDKDEHILAEIKRHDFDKEVSLLDQPAHGACTMIRTDFLRNVGGYDEAYSCQDGYELWIKFATKYPVANIREPLFFYRQHGENLTTNEERILDTRRTIKRDFISKNALELPVTAAIIPVRNTQLNGKALPFTELGGNTLLDIKIRSALKSPLIRRVVVTSADELVGNYVSEQYADEKRVLFVERPMSLARHNVSLTGTIHHVLEAPDLVQDAIEAVMILPIEFPFLRSEDIEDAINTLVIFKADSVISVRIERSSFYQHHGGGMIPILDQEKFTRLEREALYKHVGGMTLTYVENIKAGKVLNGKVGHVVVDQATSLGINSGYELEIARFWYERSARVII
ncbi:MAG: glycosyltransferase [Saprospiraceae bacterium]|nr:glycosyltransferase [Lewinella sp.]